jgi:hypothetical protein
MTTVPDSPDTAPAAPASTATQAAGAPVLRIVAGQPTAEETAAVVVVLSALAGQRAPAAAPGLARSPWSARSRLLREPVSPGPGGWRASALPR